MNRVLYDKINKVKHLKAFLWAYRILHKQQHFTKCVPLRQFSIAFDLTTNLLHRDGGCSPTQEMHILQ